VEAPRKELVLDASAVIALFRDERSAPHVEALLRDARGRITTVNAAETVDVLVRVYGWDADEVVAGVEQLLATVVEPVEPSVELATRAGELRAQLFHRQNRRVSLADCFVLAVASSTDRVITSDETLANAARTAGLDVVVLDA
jgi:uncharacterized protein with PIN domain